MSEIGAPAGTKRGAGIFTRFGLLVIILVCLGCSAPRAICAASASQQVLGRSRIAHLPASDSDTHLVDYSTLSVPQRRVERADSRREVDQLEEDEEQDRGRDKTKGDGTMREQQQLEQQQLQQQQQQQQLQQQQQQQQHQQQQLQQHHQQQGQQRQLRQQQQQPQQQQQQRLRRKGRLDEEGKKEQQSERWRLARALITIKRSSSTATPRIRTPYPGVKAHVVVDKKGRGNYTTIQKALNEAPGGREGAPYVIYVRAGTYAEGVSVDKEWIAVVGDGPTKTIVRRSQSAANGYSTYFSAVFGVNQDGFAAVGMRFVNDARDSPGVALRITGDMALVLNCDIIGFQDTLYAHSGRQYYRFVRIQGTVDFICGRAAAVFDRCTATLTQRERKNLHTTVMASGSDTRDDSLGFVFVNGALRGNTGSGSNYGFLGRPWKRYSRMVYINTYMSSVLRPDGWSSWDGELWGGRPFYAEYGSRGPGGRSGGRVSFAKPGRISKAEAARFLPGLFLDIESWKKYTIVPWLRYTTTV